MEKAFRKRQPHRLASELKEYSGERERCEETEVDANKPLSGLSMRNSEEEEAHGTRNWTFPGQSVSRPTVLTEASFSLAPKTNQSSQLSCPLR